MLFGLTGGLVPCPASLTVLLVCLQLKRFALGSSLVLAFGVGLALTLVTTGAVAAWSVRHASRRWAGFGDLSRKLPYLSATVLTLLGLLHGRAGLVALAGMDSLAPARPPACARCRRVAATRWDERNH